MSTSGSFHLTAETAVDDRSGSQAVAYAARELRQDIRRTCGLERGRPAAGTVELRLDPPGGAFDAHRIAVRKDRVIISGSDELGLIHGVYAFAERWLGADPCRYFTGIAPELSAAVAIPCGETASRPYTFRHRGFFFNDEDLLVGFHMEKPEDGFNMEVWRELLCLALRLQCTCVIPGTNILPDEPQVKLASDMGLHIAQHHAEPLGSAPYFWPRGIPFSWSTNRQQMLDYWRKAVLRQAGKKVLWTLNFRGLMDRPFWVDDPNMAPDAPLEKKARVINEVLAAQYRLIQEVRGEEKPEVYGYLWGELHQLYSAGLLEYPAGTTIIHTDGSNACMADNLEDLVRRSPYPTGVYQHVSMFTGALTMRLTSYRPSVYARELKRVVDLGMDRILIVNVGNVREKIFNLRQVMGYANDYRSMAAAAGADGDGYFPWYCREVLGTDSPEPAEAYRALTEIPFVLIPENPDYRVGDNLYTNIVRYTLQQVWNREDAPPAILRYNKALTDLRGSMDWIAGQLAEAAPKWEAVQERAADAARHLSGSRRDFYRSDAVAQAGKALHLTNMALSFCRSVQKYLDKDWRGAHLEAWQAIRHAEAALEVERSLETGRFKGWHHNDLNCRTTKCRGFLATWHAMLSDQRWMNLGGLAEGPQCVYASYKYREDFPTAYRPDLHLHAER